MARVGSVALVALLVSACAPTIQERVQQYNDAGVRLFHDGEYDHAREEFQAALGLLPNNAALLYNLGQCCDQLGQTDRAEQFYRACLKQDVDQADCRHALDVLLVNRGRIAEAQEMVQDWLTGNPKLAAAYAEDGWLYRQEGDPIKAIKRYQQAISLDAHNSRALVEMGQTYEELGHPDRSLLLYQTALNYNPHQPELVKRVNRLRTRGVGPPRPES